MKCQSCRNKDLCKWIQDMLRLDEICGDTLKHSESPVSLEIVCKRYQSEAQGIPRGANNPYFDEGTIKIDSPTKETSEEISSQVIKEIRENNRKLPIMPTFY